MPRLALLLLASLAGCSSASRGSTAVAPPVHARATAPTLHPRAVSWTDPALPDGAIHRFGHANPHGTWATRGVFSPDGRMFAWVDRTSLEIEVVNTGARVAHVELGGYRGMVAFSPDGTRIAAFAYPDRFTAWDVATGEQLVETTLTFAASDNYIAYGETTIAIGSYGGEIALVDPSTGKLERLLQHPHERMANLGFAPGGDLVSMGEFGWARWRDGVPTFHETVARAHALSQVEDMIAVEYGERTQILDLDGRVLATLDVDLKPSAFTADGTGVIGTVDDRDVVVVDATTGAERARLDCVIGPAAVSPDGRTIAIGTALFDLATAQRIPADDLDLVPIAFSHDGDELYARTRCTLYRLDVATGEVLEAVASDDQQLPWQVGDLVAHPAGGRVVVKAHLELIVREVGGAEVARLDEGSASFPTFLDANTIVYALQDYSGNGTRVIAWHLEGGEREELFKGKPGTAAIHGLEVSPDGATIAIRRFLEPGIILLHPGAAAEPVKLDARIDAAFGLRDDGTVVLNRGPDGDGDDAWQRWDLATRAKLAEAVPYSEDSMYSLAQQTSPDAMLAGYVRDQMLHVVETTAMQPLAEIPTRDGQYALANGGRRVAVLAADGSVLVYDVAAR